MTMVKIKSMRSIQV